MRQHGLHHFYISKCNKRWNQDLDLDWPDSGAFSFLFFKFMMLSCLVLSLAKPGPTPVTQM